MRTIKFRVWDDGKMIYDPIIPYDWKLNDTLEGAYDEIMQFTGLKDRDGNEIYEGDILDYYRKNPDKYKPYVDRGKRRVVAWNEYNRVVGFSIRKDNPGEKHYFLVVGNIYENPELITNS